MLLHTIGRMGAPAAPNKWTEKYIFPGYYVPSLSEIVGASEKTKMICSDVEALRLHYGLTLLHWYRRVQSRRDEIIDLYDERFLRMWEFYLASSIVGFRHGSMINYQIQYIRDRHALPLTRTYMGDEEARLLDEDLRRTQSAGLQV
jgi:cyclopropane-fatty-acyl-phospholipid synthase